MSDFGSDVKHIVQERGSVYGPPRENFAVTAALWEPIFGVKITTEQVALAMIQVKIARLMRTPNHKDSILDVAGYADCLRQIVEDGGEEVTRPLSPVEPIFP